MGDILPNDSRGSGKMPGRVGEVHGAAKPMAQAVLAAKNFRHDLPQGGSEHYRVSVAAITGHHDVRIAPRGKGSDDAGLSAIAQMSMPPDYAGVFDESALDSLFEFADANHLGVHPLQFVAAGFRFSGGGFLC